MRLLLNMLTVAVELALVAGTGWLAWKQPLLFMGLTLVLALGLGLKLELARITHEMPFYFERSGRLGAALRLAVGSGEAILKALVVGGIALITFSGTDAARLLAMAAIFAVLVLTGSMALRRAHLSLGMKPARWGYFRMGAPLGLLVSVAMGFFPAPTTGAIAWRALFDLPQRPNLAQLGETLFQVRLWADDMIVRVLGVWLGPDGAKLAGLVISSNVLTGFLVALYAVAISEVVRAMEEGRGLS
ncbi:MAG: hypothetical protein ACKVP7_15695 [Hyphomicrobiaceae bacterium]